MSTQIAVEACGTLDKYCFTARSNQADQGPQVPDRLISKLRQVRSSCTVVLETKIVEAQCDFSVYLSYEENRTNSCKLQNLVQFYSYPVHIQLLYI